MTTEKKSLLWKVWKENWVKYTAIHLWVVKALGKSSKYLCVDCGKPAHQWSNIDHQYRRKLDDYSPRCFSCHKKYDSQFKNNQMSEKYVRNLVNLWEDQDKKLMKIAEKRRVPKTQIIREVIEVGLKVSLKK